MGKRTKRHHHRHHQRQPGEQQFSYRWSPANLAFNIYFYLFSYLYITRTTRNNNMPHLKSPKNQYRLAALGLPAIKFLGWGVGGLNKHCEFAYKLFLLLSSHSFTTFKKYFFLTRELSLINTCCWRADHEILMPDGASRSALIFVDLPDNTCVNQR